MTHGYEFFLYEYVDLDEFYAGESEEFQEKKLNKEIDKTWGEIEDTYDIFED